MKKILVVNNYSMEKSLEWSKAGKFPAQHTWGCDKLSEKAELKYYVHTLPPIFHRLHLARVWYYIQNFIILLRAIGCDGIYVAASPLVDLLGFFKHIGLYKKRIVMVIHHPGNFSLNRQRYDKLIFICKRAYDRALEEYPQFRDRFVFQNWGPDLNFYKDIRPNMNIVSFISNGITDRDNEILVSAVTKTNLKATILCNQQSIPRNYIPNSSNISLVFNKGTMMNGKLLSYIEMIKLVSEHSICVIPRKRGRTTLCGLTSFCDAIALGMPVLLADTTHIYVDFNKYPFGCYYEAGNVDDLAEKMKWFSEQRVDDLERMSQISRSYAEENDYDKFAEIVCREVLE